VTKGGAGGRGQQPPAVAAQPPPPLPVGASRAVVWVPATVGGRDWLRDGVSVSLWQTWLQTTSAVDAARVVVVDDAAPAGTRVPVAAATSSCSSGEQGYANASEATPPLQQLGRKWQLVGSCRLPTALILDARGTPKAAGQVKLLPQPPLFDERGIRLSVEDGLQRAAQQPVGSARFTLAPHCQDKLS